MYKSINIKEIDYINNKIVIDIRDKYLYNLAHIRNSINIPYNYLYIFPNKYLNKYSNYYIYCDSGSKSRKMCIYLNKLGYNTIDLIGGYKEYERNTNDIYL